MEPTPTTYSYLDLAYEFDRTERTMYRWVAHLKELYPNTIITDNGRITEVGYSLICQHAEELREKKFDDTESDFQKLEDEESAEIARSEIARSETPHSEIVTRYMGDEPPTPDFQQPKADLSKLLAGMTETGKQIGFALGYQATISGLGAGIAEGQSAAIQTVEKQVSL